MNAVPRLCRACALRARVRGAKREHGIDTAARWSRWASSSAEGDHSRPLSSIDTALQKSPEDFIAAFTALRSQKPERRNKRYSARPINGASNTPQVQLDAGNGMTDVVNGVSSHGIARSTSAAPAAPQFEKNAELQDLDIAPEANKGISTPENLTERPPLNDKRVKRDQRQVFSKKSLNRPTITLFSIEQGEAWSEEKMEQLIGCMNRISRTADKSAGPALWDRVRPRLTQTEPADQELKSRIFARFLRLMFQVRQTALAVQVWNYMMQIQQQTELRHWHAMMLGCVDIRDVVSLQQIWSHMKTSKITPDMETWTTYIYGTAKCGQVERAVKILEELGRLWQSDSKALEPSIGPVHGAMSGIIESQQRRQLAWIPKILAWARSHQVKFEQQTYNILLQSMIFKATPEMIRAHFEQRIKAGCPPDIFTYNILLKLYIGSVKSPVHDLPVDEQVDLLQSLFSDMQAQGIETTGETYTSIFHGLLHTYHNRPINVKAVHLMLEHMVAHGISPSTHQLTVLLEHLFASTPPNLDGVEKLIDQLSKDQKKHRIPTTDNSSASESALSNEVFLNRLITGYAKCNEFEKALRILESMPEQGMAPSWITMTEMLRCLRRVGQLDMCKQLIDDVERGDTMRWGGTGIGGKGWMLWTHVLDELKVEGVIPGINDRKPAPETLRSVEDSPINRQLATHPAMAPA